MGRPSLLLLCQPLPQRLLECWPWVPSALSKKDLGCWFDVHTLEGVSILIQSWKRWKNLERTRKNLLTVEGPGGSYSMSSKSSPSRSLHCCCVAFAQCCPGSGTGPQDPPTCQPPLGVAPGGSPRRCPWWREKKRFFLGLDMAEVESLLILKIDQFLIHTTLQIMKHRK